MTVLVVKRRIIPTSLIFLLYGFLTTFFCNVTAVCASSLPLIDAPVFMAINVLSRMVPTKCEVEPRVVLPATCQNTFFGSAPPVKMTFLPLAMLRVPAIWNIQTSVELPLRVSSVSSSNK